MSSKFTHKKKAGGFEGLIKRTRRRANVEVGIIDAGKHDESDETVASIAFKHELGIGVPERPFMRLTMAQQRKKIIAIQKRYAEKINRGEMTVNEALGLVGEKLQADIKNTIVAIRTPPNSLQTQLEKGSSNPLIDTSQMKNSVIYKVNS